MKKHCEQYEVLFKILFLFVFTKTRTSAFQQQADTAGGQPQLATQPTTHSEASRRSPTTTPDSLPFLASPPSLFYDSGSGIYVPIHYGSGGGTSIQPDPVMTLPAHSEASSIAASTSGTPDNCPSLGSPSLFYDSGGDIQDLPPILEHTQFSYDSDSDAKMSDLDLDWDVEQFPDPSVSSGFLFHVTRS